MDSAGILAGLQEMGRNGMVEAMRCEPDRQPRRAHRLANGPLEMLFANRSLVGSTLVWDSQRQRVVSWRTPADRVNQSSGKAAHTVPLRLNRQGPLTERLTRSAVLGVPASRVKVNVSSR